VKSSQRKFLLLFVLLLAVLLLSGCSPYDAEGNYQPTMFEPLAAPLRATVVFFHDVILKPLQLDSAWGWAIILVALLIRVLLLPLGLKQMRSMREAQAKMKILQPELDKIKKKYAKDKQRLQQEQMKLYQEHGITQAQMAGCLPTLLQMPILFAFYYALIGLAAEGKINESRFFFIPDISQPSYRTGLSWLTTDFSLEKLIQPEIWPYLVLPALLAITQYVMIKTGQMGQTQPGMEDNPASGMMNQMVWLMTASFVFFALQVPAGLSLYWVVGNVLALGQQVYVNRQKERWEEEMTVRTAAMAKSLAANNQPDSEETDEEQTGDAAPLFRPQPVAKTDYPRSATQRKRRKRR